MLAKGWTLAFPVTGKIDYQRSRLVRTKKRVIKESYRMETPVPTDISSSYPDAERSGSTQFRLAGTVPQHK